MADDHSFSYNKKHFIGRKEAADTLHDAILEAKLVVVHGLAGMGKSALVGAASVAAGPELGAKPSYVDCAVQDSVKKVVAAIGERLPELDYEGAPSTESDPDVLRSAVIQALSERSEVSLVVLDNLEVIWWDDERGVRLLLEDLGAGPSVSIVVAIRAAEPPAYFKKHPDWGEQKVGPLDEGPAAELFVGWAPRFDPEDVELRELVTDELSCVPLAIVLMARQADADRDTTIALLREEVSAILAQLPLGGRRDRFPSLEASLKFSIDRLRNDREAFRLLALLGVLPAGIFERDADALADSLPLDVDAAASRLAELGLAFRDEGPRLDTLKPIRDYLDRSIWPLARDLVVARDHYLGLARSGDPPAGDRGRFGRLWRESPNVASLAATLQDRGEECDALLRQGDAELRAGNYLVALDSFRKASQVAHRARDASRLALAALGASGGLTGSGHSFDRADEERLALLREAEYRLAEASSDEPEDGAQRERPALVDVDRRTLQLRVVTRLLAELHFDASKEATHERDRLDAVVAALAAEVTDPRARRDVALQRQKSKGPLATPTTSSLDERLEAVRALVDDAAALSGALDADRRVEVEARLLYATTLMAAGNTEEANQQLEAADESIGQLGDPGLRDRLRLGQRVMRRSQRHFAGKLASVREELLDQKFEGEDPTNSPYRRWLNQSLLLALDTAEPSKWSGDEDWVAKVEVLQDALEAGERRKFGLASGDDLDSKLAYNWWPTWRATHALLLATRGSDEDRAKAHQLIEGLAGTGERSAARFGRILQHEYYVQVLALLALAVQRLTIADPGRDADDLGRWAKALNMRLAPFYHEFVVPGSGVMNLGSVQSFRGLLHACAGDQWHLYNGGEHCRIGIERNREVGGHAAAVRAQVTFAEVDRLTDPDRSAETAAAVLAEARELGMDAWRMRAERLL